MKIGLRDIEYFAAVAEHRHVGRAAEAVGLTQPALSRSLARLQRSLDTRLVLRTPKGVELTMVGTAFLARVQGLRLSLDDIAHEVEDLTKGRSGHLRIGANGHAAEHLLPASVGSLLHKAPKLNVKVRVGHTTALEAALRAGELDVIISGITSSAGHDLAQLHLWDDDYFVYVSTGHRLADRKRLTIADVATEGWALPEGAPPTVWLQRRFEDSGVEPPALMLETNSLSLTLRAVMTSSLLGFLPRISARSAPDASRLAELRVKDLAWRRPLVARYRDRGYLCPAARLFLDILDTTAKQIAARRR
jgi:DNA-binding transcriptional LysR family regulator